MFRPILTIFLAALLMVGALAEFNPVLARRGADDSPALTDDQRRGRGRGQDDFLEQQQQTGRRGQHHLQEGQGQGHRQGQGRDDDLNRPFLDDSGGRGRGRDGR